VELVNSPATVRSGVQEKPGVSVGTMKTERPRCLGAAGSVRVASQTWSAYWMALV
jgi:hypothetical protein